MFYSQMRTNNKSCYECDSRGQGSPPPQVGGLTWQCHPHVDFGIRKGPLSGNLLKLQRAAEDGHVAGDSLPEALERLGRK